MISKEEIASLGDPVGAKRTPPPGSGGVEVRLFDSPTVDEEAIRGDFEDLAGEPHTAFDEVAVVLGGNPEDGDIASPDRSYGEEGSTRASVGQAFFGKAVDELVDHDVVTDLKAFLHGSTGDLEGLQKEGAHE